MCIPARFDGELAVLAARDRFCTIRELTRGECSLSAGRLFVSGEDAVSEVFELVFFDQSHAGTPKSGPRHAGADAAWMKGFQFALAGPIYAGTNEIQRNVVAERVLGLPRK